MSFMKLSTMSFKKSSNLSFKPLGLSLLLIASSAAFTGCASFLSATHKQPIALDPGQRTRGEVIDDKQIETLLEVNINKLDPSVKNANIDIHSFNGVVLLTGQMPSAQLRDMAGDTASAVKTVRQVHNQISVASKPTIYSRINDDWIATKITSKIANSRKVEVNRVKIIVANREVFIMGLLTETETQQVTEMARTTTGVEKVVRAVEIVPEHQRAPL